MSRTKRIQLPRAPLPRQTGGPHRVKKDEPDRKRKHKGDQASDQAKEVFDAMRRKKCPECDSSIDIDETLCGYCTIYDTQWRDRW